MKRIAAMSVVAGGLAIWLAGCSFHIGASAGSGGGAEPPFSVPGDARFVGHGSPNQGFSFKAPKDGLLYLTRGDELIHTWGMQAGDTVDVDHSIPPEVTGMGANNYVQMSSRHRFYFEPMGTKPGK